MTRILHASDMHFGRVTEALIEPLLHEINRRRPDLVALSGDFTQSGLIREFIAAQDFIARIEAPVFTVPGNHDIPRHNVAERFLDPFRRYRRFIHNDADPVYETDSLIIAGLNTARPIVPHWNWSHGMVSERQIASITETFENAPRHKCRIFVCHHPLLRLSAAPMDTIVWRGQELAEALKKCNVELVLTGHIHHASVTPPEQNDSQIALIGASTATSSRLRAQANGYNVIDITDDSIQIDLLHWQDAAFSILQSVTLPRKR